MKVYKGVSVNACDEAMPSPAEEEHIKILYHTGTEEPYGFMCKRCGAEWTFDRKRCHEPYCTFHS